MAEVEYEHTWILEVEPSGITNNALVVHVRADALFIEDRVATFTRRDGVVVAAFQAHEWKKLEILDPITGQGIGISDARSS